MAQSMADVAQSVGVVQWAMGVGQWCDCLDKFYLQVACNFSFRLAKGGNKDQLWFFPKKKQVVQWQTVVFAEKGSYTVVVMPRP